MKEIKTIEGVVIYNLLNQAKVTKLNGSEKIQIIKVMQALQEITNKYKSALEVAENKLKGEKHDEYIAKLRSDITEDEKKEIESYFIDWRKEIDKAMQEKAEELLSLNDTITQDAFEKLLDSNDFAVNEIMIINKIVE